MQVAYRKIKRQFRIRMVDVGVETGLFVGLQFVGQRGGCHGRHEGGQEANDQDRKAHCVGQGVRRVWDSIGMALLSKERAG